MAQGQSRKDGFRSRRGNELKAQARANLTSEYGIRMRSLRSVEVESVFGNIKRQFWHPTIYT
ncbi:MAG: transposase [Desulfosporosinus sp.]